VPGWLCVDNSHCMQATEKSFVRAMEAFGACLPGFAQESWSQHHSSELRGLHVGTCHVLVSL